MPLAARSPAAPLLRLDRRHLARGVRALSRKDPVLRQLVQRHGPPPLWARPSGFPTLARIILEQQVSLDSARAMYLRLERELGAFAPPTLLRAGESGLRSLGVTRQKAAYLTTLAREIESGRLRLSRLHRLPDEGIREILLQLRGIGPWTADIYLLMALRRPDVWPRGDLALHQAMRAAWRMAERPGTEAAERFAARWSPWRAVAARILWHSYLSERTAKVPG